MKIEIYTSEKEDSVTALPFPVTETDRLTLLEDDSVLIKTIEGEDWNDCMTKYHEFMGWEPYKPFNYNSLG